MYLASNPPFGMALDYFSKAAGPVTVSIKDKSGKDVRTIDGRGDAGVINRVVWDLRSDAPVRPANPAEGGRGGRGGGRGSRGATEQEQMQAEQPAETQGRGGGGGRGGLTNRGPLVDAGQYTVTIAMAGKTQSQTVTVEDDPRVTIADADRAKRRQALERLIQLTRDAEMARRKIVAMSTAINGLEESWKRPGAAPVPDSVRKAVDDFSARIKAVIGTFQPEPGGRGGGAGPALRYVPPPVSQRIGRVAGQIDSYSSTPTARQMADIDEAAADVKDGVAEVNKLFDEMPRLNKTLADAGVPYFTADPNSVPPAPGGRGGVVR